MVAAGKLPPLPSASQAFADRSYCQTTLDLCTGLKKAIELYAKSDDPRKQRIWRLWSAAKRD